jgi:toxin ParE1/3/4
LKRYEIVLTEDAERDLEDLYHHIAEYDQPKKADHVLERLRETAEKLSTFPEEGLPPKELRAIGIQEYRQVFFKPYRLIYRIIESQVVIYLIADGRRDMQSLLARRLLGG